MQRSRAGAIARARNGGRGRGGATVESVAATETLMTSCSKEFKRFDFLPVRVLVPYEQQIAMLKKAKDAIKFTSGRVYTLWDFFPHNIEVINSDRIVSGVRLVLVVRPYGLVVRKFAHHPRGYGIEPPRYH